MSNYTFEQIKGKVLKWSQNDIIKQLIGTEYMEITKNEENLLLIDLTFEYCLAQIVVSKPVFAPFQYVSFEAMTLESKRAQDTGKPEIVCFFYDSADMLDDEVLDELSFCLKLCTEYIPDKLMEMYFNKTGLLKITTDTLHHVIHPNDVEKYNEDLVAGDFNCIDTEAQYLLVKNNLISLRVLPQVFINK
mgnify:CR=1 FL=1|jgi:hypothetical protein